MLRIIKRMAAKHLQSMNPTSLLISLKFPLMKMIMVSQIKNKTKKIRTKLLTKKRRNRFKRS